jgi:prepilin-type N-terminal cleavage/methylation domain-containing protein
MVTSRNAGYTLTEMMMTVAIIGILASIAPPMLIQTQRFFRLSQTRIALQQEARPVMENINRALRQASAQTIVIDQVSGQPYYSRIQFYEVGATTITYYQSGTNLIELRGKNKSTLATDVVYLSFNFPRSDNMGLVSVAVTLQQTTYQGQIKALHMASQKVQVMNP